MLAQCTHHLIGEAQAFFYISIEFGPVNPSIKRANLLCAGNLRGEFPSDNLCKTFDYFRPSKGLGLSISGKIGARQIFTLGHGLLPYELIYGKVKPNIDLNPISIPIFAFPN